VLLTESHRGGSNPSLTAKIKIMKVILFVALPSELPKELVPNGIDVVYTGVGKVNAAIKATETLKDLDPKDVMVMNYGSAGGHAVMVGNLFKCKTFIQNDMDARPFADKTKTPFDNETLMGDIDFNGLGYNKCYTQDHFQTIPSVICDMEAYSIAKVCKIYGFDFTAYKYVSDSGNADDWETNHNKGIEMFLKELQK
jgi:adenosylhomocysteine nucleosidase